MCRCAAHTESAREVLCRAIPRHSMRTCDDPPPAMAQKLLAVESSKPDRDKDRSLHPAETCTTHRPARRLPTYRRSHPHRDPTQRAEAQFLVNQAAPARLSFVPEPKLESTLRCPAAPHRGAVAIPSYD